MLTLFRRALSRLALFQYKGSMFTYLGMKGVTQIILGFLPDTVTIPTPYGRIMMPKTARMLSSILDLVELQAQESFHEHVKNARVFVDVGAAYG